MKQHDCGCVTEKGIYKFKCPGAMEIAKQLDWAYEEDRRKEVDYFAWVLDRHIKQ